MSAAAPSPHRRLRCVAVPFVPVLTAIPTAILAAVLATCLGAGPAAAQAPWTRLIGGASSGEGILDLRENPEGGYFVAAWTDSFGTRTADGWLLHLDSGGNLASERVVGTAALAGAEGAALGADGSAVFAGRDVVDIFSRHDAWLVRVDAAGTELWRLGFDRGGMVGRHFLVDVAETLDGGWVACGLTSAIDAPPFSAWIVKVAADGTFEWQREYNGGGAESLHAVVATRDGGYALTGWTTSSGAGGEDIFVLKLDAAGDLQWQVSAGGAGRDIAEDLVELSSGGYAVAGFTDSFTGSGHAPFLLRLDANGGLLWSRAFGDAAWGDFGAVTETASGGILAFGRIAEAGIPSNDLWAVELKADDASLLWQRAYQGELGDYGEAATLLADGGFLLGGLWGWGFPEEDLWLLRTDPAGQLPGCELVRDTALVATAPRLVFQDAVTASLPPAPLLRSPVVVTGESFARSSEPCAVACPPLRCDELRVEPDPACPGEEQTFTALASGGSPPLVFAWDLDGDTLTDDAIGNPVVASLPPGTTTVTVAVSDSCPDPGSACSLSVEVLVDGAPPGEVSDVPAGRAPLRVDDRAGTLRVEALPEAVAYNVLVDAIGSWYAPSLATGSACHLRTWTDNGDGTLSLVHALPLDSWVLVSASNACGEGGLGRDSRGTERRTLGTFEDCGPAR